MNCNCDYKQCNQSFGCPVRATPAECLKAGACQSDPCHCETLDKPIAEASSIGFWAGVLFWVCMALFLTALFYRYPVISQQFF